MWESLFAVGDEDEDLRQGDLLQGLLVPILKLPFRFAHSGSSPSPGDPALLETKNRYLQDFIVVSQCCELEKRGNVALAPVKKVRPPDGRIPEFLSSEPDSGAGYVFNVFALDSIVGVIEEPENGLVTVASLEGIQTFSGDTKLLRPRLRARMSPAGRRLLRIKLSLFWGRAEAEDEAALEAAGIPVGLRFPAEVDAPVDAEDGASAPPAGDERAEGAP